MSEQKKIEIGITGSTDQLACMNAIAQVMDHFNVHPAKAPGTPDPLEAWQPGEVNGIALWFQMTYFRNPSGE